MKSPAVLPWLKWGLLLLIVVIRLYDVCTREQLHPDEIYSVLISQCNQSFYTSIPDGDYTGAQLQSQLIAHHSFTDDIAQLHTNNYDVPHASLYYMLLRGCLGDISVWNPVQIVITGGILNIIFLIFSYILLWSLLMRLTRNKGRLTTACCAAAFLNPAAGECAILVREYQLAMLGVICFTYSAYLVYLYLTQRKYKWFSIRTLLPLTLSFALCMSSGYLNAFYIILLPTGILGILLIRQRRFASDFFMTVILAGIAGLLLSWALYTGYFHFITDNSVHKAKAFSSLWASISVSLNRDILYGTLTIPYAALLLALCLLNYIGLFNNRLNKKLFITAEPTGMDNAMMLIIAISVILSVISVQYTSLLRQARYSYPYLPMLSVLLPLCLNRFTSGWEKFISLAVMLYFICIAIITTPTKNYGWIKQRELLKEGAVLHNLNPNELPLVYPLLNTEAKYRVEHTNKYPSASAQVIIIHNKPAAQEAKGKKVERMAGPLRIIYK